LRFKRSKRIVSDLGTRCRTGSQKCTFPGVGHPDQPDIGDEFEFELEITFLTESSGFGVSGGLVSGVSEMPVSSPPFSAPGNNHSFSWFVQVRQEKTVIIVVDQCTDGNRNNQIFASFSVLFFALTVHAAGCGPMVFPGKIEESVFILVRDKNDRSPIPTVSTIRSAFGNVLLPSERYATGSSVASFDVNEGFIDEHKIAA
jgi:hypothetical protein